jgi:hypothetical protein
LLYFTSQIDALHQLRTRVGDLGYEPPINPPNEKERQAAVERYGILDTPPEPSYDNLVNINN